MSIAMHSCRLYSGGTPIAVTAEATSLLSGAKYQISDLVRRVISPFVVPVVNDAGGMVPASNYRINYFNGTIDFTVAPTAPVTVNYEYVPKIELGNIDNISVEVVRDIKTDTAFNSNAGWNTKKSVMLNSTVEYGGFESLNPTLGSNGVLAAINDMDVPLLVLFTTEDSAHGFGGWYKHVSGGEQITIDDLLKGNYTLESAADPSVADRHANFDTF